MSHLVSSPQQLDRSGWGSRALTLLLDLSILTALAEQILWEGRQSWALVFAALCFVILASRHQARFPVPMLFTIGVCALVSFWSLSVRDDWQYCDLSGRPCLTSVYVILSALLGLLAVAKLSLVSCRNLNPEGLVAAGSSVLAIFIVCPVLVSGLRAGALSFSAPSLEALSTVGCIVLVALRALLADGIRTWGRWVRFLAYGALAASGFLLGMDFKQQFHGPFTLPALVPGEEMPESFVLPLLVAEDPLFMRHRGIDFKRIREDLRETLELGHFKRGGSTISMQLAKIRFLNREKTLRRKLYQVFLALALERKYSKAEILAAYVKSVPFGDDVIGLRNASWKFFQRGPANLSPAQALSLVVSIYNPSEYNPEHTTMPKQVKFRAITITAREGVYKAALRHDLETLKIAQLSQ